MHYRQHPDCKTLVCFVYDPDNRLANYDALESDVS
jgi:REase_DpnII-MboI